MLKLDLEYKRSILFIRLNGSLTRRSAYKIYNYLVPVLKKHKIKYLIYNFMNLKSIDEAGIDALLSTKCVVKKHKGKICLCEVNNNLFIKIRRLKIKTTSSELTALKMIEV